MMMDLFGKAHHVYDVWLASVWLAIFYGSLAVGR